MNKSKTFFSIFTLFIFCLATVAGAFAQTENKPPQADPVYEVVLHTVVASNNASGKSDVPQALSGVIKKLKNNYTFNNYHVTSIYLQRVASGGNIDYKSVVNRLSQAQNTSPIFSDWSLYGLRNLQDSKGQTSIQFQSFRFGQRVPVTTRINDDNGKVSSVVSYEQIGLTLSKSGLPISEPTVIGSLATADDELTFLVLTVSLM